MGSIQICESGTADCYVEQSGQLLSSATSAFFSVVPVLLGALVLVCTFVVVKYLVGKIKL